jgi:FAD/FMN-containing dehydrogenase
LVIPRGWILPVTPGTQWVTVGGAIANDVHGKNHHRQGSFGEHLQRIRLIRTDGEIIECSPTLRPDWFAATVGGLGLTGVIVEAEIQLEQVTGPWMDTETLPYTNLEEFFQLSDTSESEWEHTVSWVDCTSKDGGRGLFMRGKPTDTATLAVPKNYRITFPLMPPVSLVNQISLRLFNSAYFHMKKRQAGRRLMWYESFLYPLDNLLKWNRMYGAKGFYQYQCVVPNEGGQDAVQKLVKEIKRSGGGSFLTVLKKFGNRPSIGMLSFIKPGVTLALDFPNKGKQTLELFDRLDAVVREAGGRIYLAKDSRMPRDLFEGGYPLLKQFLKYRDPGISSALSRRLMGF